MTSDTILGRRLVPVVFGLTSLSLIACAPAAPETAEVSSAPSASSETLDVRVPGGTYVSDPNHTTMQVAIDHLGLAPYAAYLSDVSVRLILDTDAPDTSSVMVTADPSSVFTSYRGDYKATHPNSNFSTWEEAIARQFLGADTQDTITFTSTDIDYDGGSSGQVTGDLSMNGMTKSVTFDFTLTGQSESHPFTQQAALGFAAHGQVSRADFGIAGNMNAFLSDAVDVTFSADFTLDTDN